MAFREEIIGNQRLICGDCLEVLPTLDADTVIADMPYGTGAWLRAGTGQGSDPRTTFSKEAWDVWDTRWIPLCTAITPRVAVFCPDKKIGELQDLLPDSRLFIWVKSDPRPRFKGQPAYGFESIVLSGPVQPIGGVNYLTASAPRLNRDADGTIHPHQKPIAVVKWLIELTSEGGDVVLDPFLGSGTTLVAAELLGRRGIGIEISPEYFDIACRRVEDAAKQPKLIFDEPTARPQTLSMAL